MEDNLNLFCKWKTTSILDKRKTTSFFFINGRRPQILEKERVPQFLGNERRPQILENGRGPQFLGNGRQPNFFAIMEDNLII